MTEETSTPIGKIFGTTEKICTRITRMSEGIGRSCAGTSVAGQARSRLPKIGKTSVAISKISLEIDEICGKTGMTLQGIGAICGKTDVT